MRNLSKNTKKRIAKMKLANKELPKWVINYASKFAQTRTEKREIKNKAAWVKITNKVNKGEIICFG